MAGGVNTLLAGLEPSAQRAGIVSSCADSKVVAGALVMAILLTAWPLQSSSQGMNDPTRPPPGIRSNETDAGAAVSEPVLQSVMISPTEKSAIIGGKTVKLGGTYGDARIIKITEGEVVLRSASGTETLRMYPDVSMKAIEPAPSANKQAKKKREPAVITRGKQR